MTTSERPETRARTGPGSETVSGTYIRMTCGHWRPAGDPVRADGTCATCGKASQADGPWVFIR